MSLLVLTVVSAATAVGLVAAGRSVRLRRLLATQLSPPSSPRAGRVPDGGGSPDALPLLLELVGSMLHSGLPLPRALTVMSSVAGGSQASLARAAAALELGTTWDQAWPSPEPGTTAAALRESLHFAAATGAPSASLLFARARQLRRQRHRELERRAAALGVRLVVPLGVCSLPAFLCLGVVPVLLAMLPGG